MARGKAPSQAADNESEVPLCICLISGYMPRSLGGRGVGGKIVRSVVLALVTIINHYVCTLVQQIPAFGWLLTAMQCFLSGTTLVLTPAMLLGRILKIHPKSPMIDFLLKKPPQTKAGKAICTASSNSLLLILSLLILESQVGSVSSQLESVSKIIIMPGLAVVIIIGIIIVIRSAK